MRKRWTKEKVLSEFLEFAEVEEDLTPKNITTKRNDLYIQIKRKFGNYTDFINSLGYRYEPIQKSWTPEIVIDELKERYSKGLAISDRVLSKEDNALKKAAVRYFGSLKKAIETCGIDYDEVREFTFWDKDLIKQEFLKIYRNEGVSRVNHVRELNRGLDHAIRKHYGGYKEFCEEIGININEIHAGNVRMSREQFVEELNRLKDEGKSMNPTNVHQYIPSARELSKEYFGSYANALAYIGVDINDHITDRVLTAFAGREFEKLVAEMFEELGKNYEYQYRGFDGIIPDFYDTENNTILDAKLSSWSVFNCETVEKYAPYCEKIVIIYLRGDELKHANSIVEMRSITEYYELLKECGLSYFIEEFERIKSSLYDITSTQKEAV